MRDYLVNVVISTLDEMTQNLDTSGVSTALTDVLQLKEEIVEKVKELSNKLDQMENIEDSKQNVDDYSPESLIAFFQNEEIKWGSKKRKRVNYNAPSKRSRVNDGQEKLVVVKEESGVADDDGAPKKRSNKKKGKSASTDQSLRESGSLDYLKASELVLENIKEFATQDGVCLICNKFYPSKYKAETHIKSTHLMIREHQCSVCPRAYHDKKGLYYHVTRVHPELQMPDFRTNRARLAKVKCPDDLSLETLDKYVGKNGTCLICFTTLTCKDSVTRHIKVVHLEIKKFECHKCPMKFKEIRFLRYHDRKVHADTDFVGIGVQPSYSQDDSSYNDDNAYNPEEISSYNEDNSYNEDISHNPDDSSYNEDNSLLTEDGPYLNEPEVLIS